MFICKHMTVSHQAAKVPFLACAIGKLQCSNAGSMNCLLLTIPLFPFPRAQQPLVGHGILITEASRSHSVGLLWNSDRSDAETSTWQHTALKRQAAMSPAGFESTIPASEQPQTHTWDRAAAGIGQSFSYSEKHSAVWWVFAFLKTSHNSGRVFP